MGPRRTPGHSGSSAGLTLILLGLTALASVVPSLVAADFELSAIRSIGGTAGSNSLTTATRAGGGAAGSGFPMIGSPSIGMNPPKPTMGWNSWNAFGCQGLTETLVQ